MKIQTLLGLCLSGSLLFAGSAALADKDKEKSNNRSARAIQIHIDKEGKKIAPADSDAAVSTPDVSVTTADAGLSKVMPQQNSDVKHNADGSMSAQLGTANMKYVVMTIDEDGEKSVHHVTAENIESVSKTDSAESGDK